MTLTQAIAWIASRDSQFSLQHDGGFGGRDVVSVRSQIPKRFCKCGLGEDRCVCCKRAFDELRSAILDGAKPLRAWNRRADPVGSMNITNHWQRPRDELVELEMDDAAALSWPATPDGFLIVPGHVHRVEFEAAGVRARWPKVAATGRPPVYDWESFIAEAVRRLDDAGDCGPDWPQVKFEGEMVDWCSKEKWPKIPGESAVRENVKKAREQFRKARSESN